MAMSADNKGALGATLEMITHQCGAVGASVAPTVDLRVRLCRPNLFQGAEQSRAGLGHAGIGRLAARHHRPAAFFNIRRLLPCDSLFQRRQIVGGVGAALKLVDADWRYRYDHRAVCSAVRQRLRRASKHEPAPAESDAERRERTEGDAL